ncbi:MAG: hypothetical protein NT007_12820 [Candidatus Kapabacteria bacterium]|nr:hypothetical protein [Candidatus Kapabacteria bacterium]
MQKNLFEYSYSIKNLLKFFRKMLVLSFYILFFSQQLAPALDKVQIGKININRKNVFDSSSKDWFFAAKLANSLHIITQEYFITDELLFSEGDTVDTDKLYETVRNLRKTGLFSEVKIVLDSADDDKYDINVQTQDVWSTNPEILFGKGGNSYNFGGRIAELNLAGTATALSLEALFRSENNIGMQGRGILLLRRAFRSEYTLYADLRANKYRTDGELLFYKPFRSIETEYSYGLDLVNNFGRDFIYSITKDSLNTFRERSLTTWFSKSWLKKDRIFITGLFQLNNDLRLQHESIRAFDNSGIVLLAFSSVAQNYTSVSKLNSYHTEDLPTGGWGSAVLGKVFPYGDYNALNSCYYLGGQAEASYFDDQLYLFGGVEGGSAFRSSLSYDTYASVTGLGFYRLDGSMLIASRFKSQSAWNWRGERQLILDNDYGLRGYRLNRLAGDSRLLNNLEFRYFPDWKFWILNFSGVAFYDLGTVWKQSEKFTNSRFHHSLGLGLRIYDDKQNGTAAVFRIDVAYNVDEKRIAEIILTSSQMFNVFGIHDFKLPQIFGNIFDHE